ncbi:hypothetical protein CsSME_00007251 [Camellia sinensis var. sinensis]
MKEDETTNHVNATADKSNVQPSANSVILGSCNCRVSDTVLTSGDAFSAISNDSVGLGLSYPIKFLKQKIICFHSRFWKRKHFDHFNGNKMRVCSLLLNWFLC